MSKFKRLIAFGCSHAKGIGQIDCDIKSDQPSKHSFINQCGLHLNLPIQNKSIGGASNKLIATIASNFLYNEDDLVIICWSYLNRHHYFTHNDSVLIENNKMLGYERGQISPTNLNKKSHVFYKYFYDEYDQEQDFFLRCNAINLLLEKRKISCINLLADLNNISAYPAFNLVKFLPYDIMSYIKNYGKASDGHMSYEGHTNLGYHLSKYIKEKYRDKL